MLNASQSQKSADQKCYNCGNSWPHKGGQRKCPAFGKMCGKCIKLHHYTHVCKSGVVRVLKEGNDNGDDDHDGDEYVFVVSCNANEKLPSFKVEI